MDNGHVIPGLNEDWTLAGAKANEWFCGIGAFFMAQFMFTKPTQAMPLLLTIMVSTTLGLAALRRQFPDEEKGMRNYFFMLIGIEPPDIAPPAAMQPIWSGAPLRRLDEKSQFRQLGLEEVFYAPEGEEELER